MVPKMFYLFFSLFFQEQFILSYGGLRGAVGFSLVTILDEDNPFKDIFLTTTLFVIFFTVFIQGSTIKLVVAKLNIQTKSTEVLIKINKFEKINENFRRKMLLEI